MNVIDWKTKTYTYTINGRVVMRSIPDRYQVARGVQIMLWATLLVAGFVPALT